MDVLRFWIPPISADMHDRILKAHAARGLSYWLNQTRAEAVRFYHPTDLSYLLGYGTQSGRYLRWFSGSYKQEVSLSPARQLLLMETVGLCWSGTTTHMLDSMRSINSVLVAIQSISAEAVADVLHNMRDYENDRVFYSSIHERYDNMSQDDKAQVPPEVMTRLETCLASLEQALLNKDPMMPQHLANTHSLLITYPETVHLLKDEEIARLITAAGQHTKTEIIKKVVGKKSGKSRASIDVNDL